MVSGLISRLKNTHFHFHLLKAQFTVINQSGSSFRQFNKVIFSESLIFFLHSSHTLMTWRVGGCNWNPSANTFPGLGDYRSVYLELWVYWSLKFLTLELCYQVHGVCLGNMLAALDMESFCEVAVELLFITFLFIDLFFVKVFYFILSWLYFAGKQWPFAQPKKRPFQSTLSRKKVMLLSEL